MDAAHDATKHQNNPLWMYSLKQYANPPCAEFLLKAQRHYQLDINILLFIGWLATQHRVFDTAPLKATTIDQWQSNVIKPIRALRIRVKKLGDIQFYQHMKKLELTAESQEQLQLYKLTPNMKGQQKVFEKCIQQGCVNYFENLKQELNKQWLQTLIKHLQPEND